MGALYRRASFSNGTLGCDPLLKVLNDGGSKDDISSGYISV
jgi:hypothetical protein